MLVDVPQAQAADFLRSLPPRGRLRLGRATLYLADNRADAETMLFEAALDDFSASVDSDASQHRLSAEVHAQPLWGSSSSNEPVDPFSLCAWSFSPPVMHSSYMSQTWVLET